MNAVDSSPQEQPRRLQRLRRFDRLGRSPGPSRSRLRPPYRVDFVLIVLTGNLTRYQITRPVIERWPDIESRWYPVRTWVDGDWLRFLPGHPRLRARHFLDSWRLYARRPADAVVIHALDTYSLYGLWHRFFRLRTVIVCNPDEVDYAGKRGISQWLLKGAVDRTQLFVPWSKHTADDMISAFPSIRDRVTILHPGLPIDQWPFRETPAPEDRFRVLFVGGDATRKGIHALLAAFEQSLQSDCRLDIATVADYLPPELRTRMEQMPHVRVHLDLQPGSPELKHLFATSDAFVLPSRKEGSPWVALEAMATGVPVVISGVGGIPDIVIDGETGLIVRPDDPDAIVHAIRRLQVSPESTAEMALRARRHVEQNFDAEVNSRELMELVKRHVDSDRRSRAAS